MAFSTSTTTAPHTVRRYVLRRNPASKVSRFDRIASAEAAALPSLQRSKAPDRTHIDMIAIGIALTLALLVRFNVIPHIGW